MVFSDPLKKNILVISRPPCFPGVSFHQCYAQFFQATGCYPTETPSRLWSERNKPFRNDYINSQKKLAGPAIKPMAPYIKF